ncbi:rab-GTPase-TBC domain-containing protein [Helicostylum pulchrum]|nr:rab-GTPase-TBC domain-containing protein [Helicostylum pulchrum]
MKRKQRKQRRQKKTTYREKPAQENEEFKDTFKINQALRTGNHKLLREIGRETGFLSDAIRRRVWPFLLHCTDPEIQNTMEGSLEVPHKDEEQVKLDVVRSFNSFPKNLSAEDKQKLEGQLSRVITHVLRAYPSLHYYQGFHDICSVIILLFGEKFACKLMEPIALFFKRYPFFLYINSSYFFFFNISLNFFFFFSTDEMYTTMEPVLKQLTILDTIIQLEDIQVFDFITEAGVLPYYCLSWVITWCSHDLDDLEKITRLFDFFLSSNPFMAIYFSAAVVLSRKDELLALECEMSTVHSFLTKLPKDLDVDFLCQQACELQEKYSVYDVQRQSKVALDQVSCVNRFEKDWTTIETQDELNNVLGQTVIPMLNQERRPIPLDCNSQNLHSTSVLQKLKQLERKDVAIYTLVTIGAGVGLIAMFMSNTDLVR